MAINLTGIQQLPAQIGGSPPGVGVLTLVPVRSGPGELQTADRYHLRERGGTGLGERQACLDLIAVRAWT
jgi:hypothetical protein